MSEWLDLMLGEITRKKKEAEEALLESRRRQERSESPAPVSQDTSGTPPAGQ